MRTREIMRFMRIMRGKQEDTHQKKCNQQKQRESKNEKKNAKMDEREE